MDDDVEVIELAAYNASTWATDTWDGTGKAPTVALFGNKTKSNIWLLMELWYSMLSNQTILFVGNIRLSYPKAQATWKNTAK
jgi:hypothetical protein